MSRKDTALKYFEEQKSMLDLRVKTGIEMYRKGDARIVLKSAGGSLPENITVQVGQKTHEFKLGANIFMLAEF